MGKMPVDKKREDTYTVDFVRIFKCLLSKAWMIAITSVLVAAISFSYAFFMVKPKYSSSTKLYVNNSLSIDKISISSADITASQSLIKTYIAILQSRSILEQIAETADVDYTPEELTSMITANAVNDTEIMRVTVTSEDPEEAYNIADAISVVLPDKIAGIIEGSSMVVVDKPIVNRQKVSPSFIKYTVIGFILGLVLSALVIIITDSLDDTIHDDDYISNLYGYPLLGKVQNLNSSDSKSYKYNYYYGRSASKNGPANG